MGTLGRVREALSGQAQPLGQDFLPDRLAQPRSPECETGQGELRQMTICNTLPERRPTNVLSSLEDQIGLSQQTLHATLSK